MRQVSIDIGKEYDGYSGPESLAAAIDEAIDAAVKEEREACAKVAANHFSSVDHDITAPEAGDIIATIIRQRGQS